MVRTYSSDVIAAEPGGTVQRMQITEQFTVERPIDEVWELFNDIPEVARCLPGAELISATDDGICDGKVAVKLGPISASFEGSATVAWEDSERSCTITGRGIDRAGGSQGTVDVGVTLEERDGPSTEVNIDATIKLAGAIAQFGRTGLVSEVSRRLIDQFSNCLHAKLEATTEAEAAEVEAGEVRGLSLGLAATWSTFVKWLKKLVGSKA